MSCPDTIKTALLHIGAELTGGNQDGIFIKHTGIDDVAGNGIIGIVLKDHQQSAFFQHPPAFLQQPDMISRGNVMEHTGGKDQVEGLIRERDFMTLSLIHIFSNLQSITKQTTLNKKGKEN